MVTVKGKATIPVSGSGDRASLEVAVVGCTSSHVCMVTPAEMDKEVNAQGDQSDFYAICGTDKITIYSEDKQLGSATDVYYFVTDGVFDTANLLDGSVDVDKLEGLASREIIIGVDGTAANNAKVIVSGDAALGNDGTLIINSNAITSDKMDLVVSAFLGAPVVAATDTIVTDVLIADGAQIIAAQPDVPRNLTITVTDGDTSISAGDVTIIGEDISGNEVRETLDFTTALTLTGTKIFATVTSVTVANLVGNAAGDNIKVGIGNVIGLPTDIQSAAAVHGVYFAGAREASPTVAFGASTSGVDVSASTYDGSKLLYVFYNVGA